MKEQFDSNTIVKVVGLVEKGTVDMTFGEAQKKADEMDLDLVVLSNTGDIPVVRICDYSKYQFEKKKKEKENSAKQKKAECANKEVRLTGNIAEHDLKTKCSAIDKMLVHGNRVTISIKYKGRAARNLLVNGKEMIDKMLCLLTESYRIEKDIYIAGNNVAITIVAKSKKG